MTDQPYTPPPGDQAQLDALEEYLPLLNNLIAAAQDHYDDSVLLARLLRDGSPLVVGEEKVIYRDQAYKAQGDTARAMLQAFAAMQQAAQRVGDAIAKHELKLSRAVPDVVTGQKGAPRQH